MIKSSCGTWTSWWNNARGHSAELQYLLNRCREVIVVEHKNCLCQSDLTTVICPRPVWPLDLTPPGELDYPPPPPASITAPRASNGKERETFECSWKKIFEGISVRFLSGPYWDHQRYELVKLCNLGEFPGHCIQQLAITYPGRRQKAQSISVKHIAKLVYSFFGLASAVNAPEVIKCKKSLSHDSFSQITFKLRNL